MARKSEAKVEISKPEPVQFRKDQLLKCKAYQHRKDVLNAILDDDKTYTKETVNNMIDSFMKGKVN